MLIFYRPLNLIFWLASEAHLPYHLHILPVFGWWLVLILTTLIIMVSHWNELILLQYLFYMLVTLNGEDLGLVVTLEERSGRSSSWDHEYPDLIEICPADILPQMYFFPCWCGGVFVQLVLFWWCHHGLKSAASLRSHSGRPALVACCWRLNQQKQWR